MPESEKQVIKIANPKVKKEITEVKEDKVVAPSTKIKIQQTKEPIKEKSEEGSEIKDVDIEEETNNQEEMSQAENYQNMRNTVINQLVVPSAAAEWFNLDEIHELEIDSIPEFFNGRYPSKTPQIYKEYRNFMVLLYRQNPIVYLNATSKIDLYKDVSLQKTSWR